jgi:hypothetical protein
MGQARKRGKIQFSVGEVSMIVFVSSPAREIDDARERAYVPATTINEGTKPDNRGARDKSGHDAH